MNKFQQNMLYYSLALGMFAGEAFSGMGSRRSSNPLNGIDIEKEYKLIQEKRSSLSSNLRQQVINKHNKINKVQS
jgi:hypothetical protein